MNGDHLVPGKYPEALLAPFLQQVRDNKGSLVTPPAVGEDTGAAELENGDLLVYTSDPITFTPARIGYSSVIINANDIATSGGTPMWYLATLLVPPGCPASTLQAILEDIRQTCRSFNILLAGGHTEVTSAVTRPVVSGTMFSIVSRERYINKKNARDGDVVLLTKTAGLEGTAVLGMEKMEKLQSEGLLKDELNQARRFFENISVLREAEIAVESGGVTAMHDVTEGGVATALRELSTATGRKLNCRRENIPVHPLTGKICSIMNIDPLGLLGSGSLLICCISGAAEKLIRSLSDGGIEAAAVGTLGRIGSSFPDLPFFPVDELSKVL